MERLEDLVSMLDHTLNTRKKRHLAGGVLMSISLFFGGLAITVLSLRSEESKDDEYESIYTE